MELKKRKSVGYYMRSLHRDIGFFLIGITIIYCISGIVLVYRDTNLLKHEAITERVIKPNMEGPELGMMLHIWDFKIIKSEGDIIYFQSGNYNKATGAVIYKEKVLPSFLGSFTKLHKTSSQSAIHWIPIIFGILLSFLAISSFWMFKVKTKPFRRGMYITVAGFIVAFIVLII